MLFGFKDTNPAIFILWGFGGRVAGDVEKVEPRASVLPAEDASGYVEGCDTFCRPERLSRRRRLRWQRSLEPASLSRSIHSSSGVTRTFWMTT
jgi:hypothetical protein